MFTEWMTKRLQFKSYPTIKMCSTPTSLSMSDSHLFFICHFSCILQLLTEFMYDASWYSMICLTFCMRFPTFFKLFPHLTSLCRSYWPAKVRSSCPVLNVQNQPIACSKTKFHWHSQHKILARSESAMVLVSLLHILKKTDIHQFRFSGQMVERPRNAIQ